MGVGRFGVEEEVWVLRGVKDGEDSICSINILRFRLS